MATLGNDPKAPRREVGRTLLSLGAALSRALALFERAKEDPSAAGEARAACEDALNEMKRSYDALRNLRNSLGGDGAGSISRLSLA